MYRPLHAQHRATTYGLERNVWPLEPASTPPQYGTGEPHLTFTLGQAAQSRQPAAGRRPGTREPFVDLMSIGDFARLPAHEGARSREAQEVVW